MTLAKQPGYAPTNKLTVAALIGPAVTEVWGNFFTMTWPVLGGDAMSMLAGAGAALVVGYFIPDRANVA